MALSAIGLFTIIPPFLPLSKSVHCSPKADTTGLLSAAQKGNIDLVNQILAKEIDPHACLPALIAAAEGGHLHVVKVLVEVGKVDINGSKNKGTTALMTAVGKDRADVCEYLIDRKVDVNTCDKDGDTALVYAIRSGSMNTARILLEKGGVDANAVTKTGDTMLMYAIINNKTDMVKLLIQIGKAEVDKVNKDGYTALIVAAMFNRKEAIDILLEKGADINKTDKDGATAATWAARKFHEKLAHDLKERGGINPNILKCLW
jgi:uncharacterized protein